MTISYQWLMEYLPEPMPVQELGQILTSIGLEVEAIERAEKIKGGLAGLVTGHVLSCGRHPNADKLSVTTVDVGTGTPLNIVCGAPNVAVGQKVIVATVGTTVHPMQGEPFVIKKAKIRGEESAGMICAEDEIGLGDSHAGIIILPETTPVGMSAKEYYNIPETDFAIHIGLTPNRSDANSHMGVARDVCAYLTHHKGAKHHAKAPYYQVQQGSGEKIAVTIKDPAGCPRYAGLSIDNVQVGTSPEWLQQRLQTIGVRSINNIVDVTNYVLHEYGQPLHAFDANRIAGNTIIAGYVAQDTPFMALDEKERKLNETDVIISDANGPVAIAGVFGGLHSGISSDTSSVFLESAYFDPMHVRRTSMGHGLRTDAAQHFEKGVDINNVLPALQRAAALICELTGGSVASAITDVYPVPVPERTVSVTYGYIHKLSGKQYAEAAIKETLTALGFGIRQEDKEGLVLTIPSNKTEVSQPADIVEEILRIDGLDNVALTGRMDIALLRSQPGDRQMREKFAQLLCGMGLQEIVTNSIVNSRYYPGNEQLVKMINSLSSELDVLRPGMLESGLEVVQYNCNRKQQDLALYEFGNIYYTAEGNYKQESRLGIWITGNMLQQHWSKPAQKADIFYLKGIVNNVLQHAGITNITTTFDEAADGAVSIKWKNIVLCTMVRVAPSRLKEFDLKQEVYYADVQWDVLMKAAAAVKVKYAEVPKFPAVNRDLAIVLDKTVTYAAVQQTTEQLKIDALHAFGLFDIFESEKLGPGKKSFALSYTFQLHDRTLTDAETEQLMAQLVAAYYNKLGAQVR